MTELELVQEYRRTKELVDELTDQLKEATEQFDKAKLALVDDLKLRGASQTAKYDGIGRVSLLKPTVGARSKDEAALFDYLKSIGRDDLIKQTVHHRTLSSFVGEVIDSGKQHELPEFIEVWFKDVTRLNK